MVKSDRYFNTDWPRRLKDAKNWIDTYVNLKKSFPYFQQQTVVGTQWNCPIEAQKLLVHIRVA